MTIQTPSRPWAGHQTGTFGTTTPELAEMTAWLAAHGPQLTVLGPTSSYRKPVFWALAGALRVWGGKSVTQDSGLGGALDQAGVDVVHRGHNADPITVCATMSRAEADSREREPASAQ